MHRKNITRTPIGLIASLVLVVAASAGGAVVNSRAVSAVTPTPLFPECPPIGWDSGCELRITINATGTATVAKDPGQGSYDGADDTLIGVVNNSGFAVASIHLTGPGVFDFEPPPPAVGTGADGLCAGIQNGPNTTPGKTTFDSPPAGCPFGPTYYEGPNTSFSNYSSADAFSSGDVNFLGTLPRGQHGLANGATAYFSLEGQIAATTLVITLDPLITASGVTFSATEGMTFTGTVATFTDPDTNATSSEYSATIAWGDMTSSPGTVSGSRGSFTVTGTHLYVDEGTYAVKVTIRDIDNSSNFDTADSTAEVGDAKLTSRCPVPAPPPSGSTAPPVGPQTYAGVTAEFNDSSTTGTPNDFTAQIDWGDGSMASAGMIAGGPGVVTYTVTGSHNYGLTGVFMVTTTVKDIGGEKTSISCQLIIFAFPTSNQATFVIGDLDATPLNHVTWWGSQWANLNHFSGGAPAPDAMKGFAGFEDNMLGLPPACGGTWTTDPGNSTPPPATVPNVMAVIASSKVTKSGSVISGDIKEIVIVRNDPGYAPSPGNPGTGTVLAVICPP